MKRILISLGIAVASVGSTIGTAYAAVPIPSSGTNVITFAFTGSRSADSSGNIILQFSFVENSTGTLSGTRVGTGTLVLHPDGTINVESSGVFTGTVNGSAPGTLVERSGASGTFASVTGTYSGTMGTGGLSGVLSEGTFSGAAVSPVEAITTYSGIVVFGGS